MSAKVFRAATIEEKSTIVELTEPAPGAFSEQCLKLNGRYYLLAKAGEGNLELQSLAQQIYREDHPGKQPEDTGLTASEWDHAMKVSARQLELRDDALLAAYRREDDAEERAAELQEQRREVWSRLQTLSRFSQVIGHTDPAAAQELLALTAVYSDGASTFNLAGGQALVIRATASLREAGIHI